MKVELLEFTGSPDRTRALDLLLTTKGTRLAHNEDPLNWSAEKRQEHLDYMRDTIKSSWEFVDYTFRISGVTRAFTHQLVRTRTASFAQEAMRVVDVSERNVIKPDSVGQSNGDAITPSDIWDDATARVMKAYGMMTRAGVPVQDARGILPTNIPTSIITKMNLRTLANTGELRLCTRTQGEYQNVFREMKRLVVDVHPWADDFIQVFCVNHCHCAFPRYGAKGCPVYEKVLSNEKVAEYRTVIKAKWESIRFEANPVAKDGRAM